MGEFGDIVEVIWKGFVLGLVIRGAIKAVYGKEIDEIAVVSN